MKQTMLGEAIRDWIVAVLKGVYKAIASRENHVRVQFKVHAWSEQQLLPLQPQVVPSPLALEVQLPSFADGMIAEIAVPSMLVGS